MRKIQKLIIIGLLLAVVGFFWNGTAVAQTSRDGSVGIEGKVPADPPTRPATITTPGNGQVFTNIPITVAGLCPNGTIVKIFKNNVFAGAVECKNGSFSLLIDLFSGRNDLVARVSDALDQAGPDSATVSVTFNDARFGGAGNRISLTSNYFKRGANPGQTLTWPIILSGGVGPYAFSIDWGDGKPATLLSREFPGVIDLTHIYDNPGSYNIVVKATDKNGDVAYLQLVGIANGALTSSSANGSDKDGTAAATKQGAASVVPIPLLLIILTVLALLSFWLGNRFSLLRLRRRLQEGEGKLY